MIRNLIDWKLIEKFKGPPKLSETIYPELKIKLLKLL